MFRLEDIVNSGLLKDNIYVVNNKGELTHKAINVMDTWILKHTDILLQSLHIETSLLLYV